MLSKSIEAGSLVSFKNTKGSVSYDIIYRIHYVFNANQKRIPVYYYRVLKPGKAYISSYYKLIQ